MYLDYYLAVNVNYLSDLSKDRVALKGISYTGLGFFPEHTIQNNRLTEYEDTNTTGQQQKQYIMIKQVQKQKHNNNTSTVNSEADSSYSKHCAHNTYM